MTDSPSLPDRAQPATQTDSPPAFGFWGPPTPSAPKDPRNFVAFTARRKPWGLGDLAWAFLWFVAAQIVLTAALAVVAVAQVTRAAQGQFSGSAEQVQQVLDRMTRLATAGPGVVFGLLIEWAVFVGVPVWVSRKKASGSLREDFGFFIRWRSDVLFGVGVAAALNVAFFGLSSALQAAGVNLKGSDNTGLVTDSKGPYLIVLLVAASLGAPIVEELFFRGFMLNAIRKRLDSPRPQTVDDSPSGRAGLGPVSRVLRARPGITAAVISGVVFGVLHYQGGGVGGLFLITETTTLGVVFGLIAARKRRLGPTIAAHVTNNTVASLLAIWALYH